MKLFMSGLMATGLIATIMIYGLAGSPYAAQRGTTPSGGAAQGEAKRKKITGTMSPQLARYDDAAALVNDSQLVVVGIPVYQAAHLKTRSSRLVWTDYRVKVLRVLKGNVAEGGLISVRTMGGNVILPDGTEVETQMPAFWKNPILRQGYVFFLSKMGEESPYFNLTGGPQGMFLISPWGRVETTDNSKSQVVIPQVRPSDKLMKNYDGANFTDFLKGLRRIITPTDAGR
jgi:hypothetical protein